MRRKRLIRPTAHYHAYMLVLARVTQQMCIRDSAQSGHNYTTLRHVCPPGREKMMLVGQKDKTQAVERPPGDVHLRLVAVDVINGSLNGCLLYTSRCV